MRTIKIIHKVNRANPRLSDEEVDPLEVDDAESITSNRSTEGWVPWDMDDLIDIYRIIEERMPQKQRVVMEAFLSGQSNKDIDVTEKFFRYHLEKGIEFIKQELKL
jgi:hypothetical protein